MNQRKIVSIGVIFLLTGCITSLYLALRITHVRFEGFFSAIRTDSPQNRFDKFQCPLIVSNNETFSVVATISNPTTSSYDLDIEAYGFNILSQDNENTHSEITWTWVLTSIENGDQIIIIQALSHEDLALPGIFHMWNTSFLDSCGILVVNIPLTGKQVLLLSLTSIIVGAVILFPRFYSKIRERNKEKQHE